jgi:hypothetical protein
MQNTLTIENDTLTAVYDYLGIKLEGIAELQEYDHHGLAVYEIEGQRYALGTDQEANKAARRYIEGNVWAFKAEFILDCCGLPISAGESLAKMQYEACEDANNFLLAVIKKTCGFDYFYKEAIESEGRGHFLASYDGEEIKLFGGKYYAYKL